MDAHVGSHLFNEAITSFHKNKDKGSHKGSHPPTRVLVTHQTQFLSSEAVDRVILMERGRISCVGPYSELVQVSQSKV